MRLLDLFSGIGGFSLAAQWCWGEELEIEAFVEIDPFCQKVLAKNFPGVPIYGDIKKIQWIVADTAWNMRERGKRETERTDRKRIRVCLESPINLLTGGFPCQPFSCAGKRAGTTDDRYLWPEMLRTIHEVNPRWVVAENVSGLLTLQDGMVFEGVCLDLENEGYEVLPLIIPACAKGAPHRRDRVWIVAHNFANTIGRRCGERRKCRSVEGVCGERKNDTMQIEESDCHAPDTNEMRFEGECGSREKRTSQYYPSTEDPQLGEGERGIRSNSPWHEYWYEVATRLCRVDDGVSSRVDRLKCLGNAIVPQIAYQIFKVLEILNAEERR